MLVGSAAHLLRSIIIDAAYKYCVNEINDIWRHCKADNATRDRDMISVLVECRVFLFAKIVLLILIGTDHGVTLLFSGGVIYEREDLRDKMCDEQPTALATLRDSAIL